MSSVGFERAMARDLIIPTELVVVAFMRTPQTAANLNPWLRACLVPVPF
jgi:hypothetical protein